jgi:amidase
VLAAIPEYARIDVDYWQAKYPKGSDVRPVAAECGIMTLRELEITDMANDATTVSFGGTERANWPGKILENIKNKEWTSEEVTLAFGKRACIAHQMTSCVGLASHQVLCPAEP